MLEFQENTRKEIWRAKKLIYEGDEYTKKSFIYSLVTIVIISNNSYVLRFCCFFF